MYLPLIRSDSTRQPLGSKNGPSLTPYLKFTYIAKQHPAYLDVMREPNASLRNPSHKLTKFEYK